MFPQKMTCLKFRCSDIASETIFRTKQQSDGNVDIDMNIYLPAHCALQQALVLASRSIA